MADLKYYDIISKPVITEKSMAGMEYKRYTFYLGDGQMWNFSTGNINDHAVGTKDTDSAATVISTGYSTRSINTSYYVSSVN